MPVERHGPPSKEMLFNKSEERHEPCATNLAVCCTRRCLDKSQEGSCATHNASTRSLCRNCWQEIQVSVMRKTDTICLRDIPVIRAKGMRLHRQLNRYRRPTCQRQTILHFFSAPIVLEQATECAHTNRDRTNYPIHCP